MENGGKNITNAEVGKELGAKGRDHGLYSLVRNYVQVWPGRQTDKKCYQWMG